MGKALYRTYRSRGFEEVVGQKHITGTLQNAISSGKLSHAYLFTGPRGVGKTSVARILAHAINGIPYDDEKTHLDIIEIDAASNRRIDEIRELRDKVHIAPTSAKYKVYIIDEVHMLTREAFNALLKTLEEPPAHVVFILATTEAHKVPETIVSRTQRFTFKPIEPADAIAHLKQIAKKESIKIDDQALALISEHGRGSFRDSISLLDQLAGFKDGMILTDDVRLLLGLPDESLIDQCVEAVIQRNVESIFASVALFREQGIDSGRAARSLSERFRAMMKSDPNRIPELLVIMKALLPLTTSTNDYIGLELALLETPLSEVASTHHGKVTSRRVLAEVPKEEPIHAPKSTTTVHTPEPAAKEVSTTEKPTIAPEPEIKADAEQHIKDIQPLNSDTWHEMLQAIKKQHNTLYGVLRMAEATQEGDEIVLHFNFGFHKKQIDSPRNAGIIRQFIADHFGVNQFKSVASKSTPKKEQTTPAKSSTPDPTIISSVSNIFGGAELLES